MWKNKYRTTAPEDQTKPHYQGEVIIPGDQLGQTRKIALWINKYDDGNVQMNVKIADELKEQTQQQQRPQPVNNQQNDDIDLPF